MRILYLSADRGIRFDKHNGASAHLRSMVAAMHGLGHEVRLVTVSAAGGEDLAVPITPLPAPGHLEWLMRDTEPVGRDRAAKERKRADRRIAYALGHVWNNDVVERALEAEVARARPDLIFEVYSPFGIAGGTFARRRAIPHVLNVHAPLAWEGAVYRGEALQEASALLESAAFAAAGRIVAVSEELRDILAVQGVDPAKIAVVPNGVEAAHYAMAPGERTFAADRVVVGFSGSLKPWHGVDVMLDAFERLAADPRYEFLVVGDGPERRKVEAFAARHPGRVSTTGALPPGDVPPHVKRMDIGLAPYPPLDVFYFSPLKVLDYMASGCPVVASRIGQIPDMVEDGRTGRLVPPGDAAALAEAVAGLAENPAARRAMGERAAAVVARDWTWPKRVAEMLEAATT